MRSILFVLVLLASIRTRADAVQTFAGACPPGLTKSVVEHAERCVPNPCRANSDCPSGSHCATLRVCRALRDVNGTGWGTNAPSRAVEVELGLTDSNGHCARGEPGARNQCEPIEPTQAFDSVRHEWTGQAHGAGTIAILIALVLLGRRRR